VRQRTVERKSSSVEWTRFDVGKPDGGETHLSVVTAMRCRAPIHS